MLPIKNNLKSKKYRLRGKLRYSTRKYSNPFFQEKRKRRFNINSYISWKVKLAGALLLGLSILATWFLFYSNFFVITNINASGEGNLSPEKIQNQAWDQIKSNMFILWPQKNIFLFNVATLRADLEKKYSFDKLEITKKLPRSINVSYQEKKHSIIWLEDEKYFYADRGGAIIGETMPLEIQQKDYPLIQNLSDKKQQNNTIQIDSRYLDYILKLFEELKKYGNEFKIDRFVVDNDFNTVKASVVNGPQIFFNINESIEKQINKVLVIKREKLKDVFNNKTYIDVRIGDSVYFR